MTNIELIRTASEKLNKNTPLETQERLEVFQLLQNLLSRIDDDSTTLLSRRDLSEEEYSFMAEALGLLADKTMLRVVRYQLTQTHTNTLEGFQSAIPSVRGDEVARAIGRLIAQRVFRVDRMEGEIAHYCLCPRMNDLFFRLFDALFPPYDKEA